MHKYLSILLLEAHTHSRQIEKENFSDRKKKMMLKQRYINISYNYLHSENRS